MSIVASNETLTLVIKFRIRGALRFLSHAETLRLLERACVRAGIDLRYSEGFNPHPKLSLPLPRPVGVESDEEVLRLSVYGNSAEWGSPHRLADDEAKSAPNGLQEVAAGLSAQLPEGCELTSATVAEAGASFQPCGATYLLPIRRQYLNETLGTRIERLMASERLDVQRRTGDKGRKIKNIDVRGFLTSMEMTAESIIVECRISPGGSIRVDEVLSLLELDQSMLAGPIRRIGVHWK